MGIFLYKTFPESGIAQSNPIVDNISSTTSTAVSKGEQLFKQNCASCHAIDRDLVGPALQGVGQRGPWAENRENLKKWIKDPLPFLLSDPYAKHLKEKYKTPMPSQTHLSDADIDEVVKYITK